MQFSLDAAWLVAAIIVIAVALWIKGRVARLVGDEIEPAVREFRKAVKKLDALIEDAHGTVGKIDKVATAVEIITSGAVVASAATKAFGGSRNVILSVLTGVKQGLQTLGRPAKPKEVAKDG